MILVTGASGFVGKHLISSLIMKYGSDNILAFTSQPLIECKYLHHNNYMFDSDYFALNGYSDYIDTIIHVGAFTPKKNSEANNMKDCNKNISSTARILSANLPNLKRFIYISTLDVYGNTKIISESTVLSPVSLYGDSKLYCEKMVKNWSLSTKKCYQILRLGHVYGPGEEAYHKIIPITFNKILNNKAIEIWGTGKELRSFIYINDVVSSIISSIKFEQSIGPINIVSNESISVIDLIKKMITICEVKNKVEFIHSHFTGRSFRFNNSKLKQYLLPDEISLDIGLKMEYEYMRNLRNEKHIF